MKLGVLLSLGETIERQIAVGQFARFSKFYLQKYAADFNQVFVFSYGPDIKFISQEKISLFGNRANIHRYLYTFMLPFLQLKYFKTISVFRVMQITGVIPAIIAKLFFNIPFVVTYGYKYHQFAKNEGKTLVAFWLRILEIIGLKTATGVIVTTKDLKRYVNKFTDISRIYLIPNGVDIDLFKPKLKRFDQKNIKIISVGRLEIQKNYQSLIKAVSVSKYRHLIELTIIGDGGLKNDLVSLAKEKSVRLKIIKSVQHDKIYQFLQDSDIFVLPSLIEGHPKSLIEALSCGLPSVGSNIPGIDDLIKDGKTGLLCTTSYQDIAKEIDRLIQDSKLRTRLSEAGRRLVKTNYDIKKLVDQETRVLIKIASY